MLLVKAEGDVYDKLNAVNVIFPCVGEGMCSRESFDKHVSELDYIPIFLSSRFISFDC